MATAQRFIAEGAQVVVFDINESAFAAAQEAMPGLAGLVAVDVSKEESVRDGFLMVDRLIGGIDILISNAGISIRNKFVDTDFAQWKKVLGINLDGMYLCCKEAIDRMMPQTSGFILMTSTNNGKNAHPYTRRDPLMSKGRPPYLNRSAKPLRKAERGR